MTIVAATSAGLGYRPEPSDAISDIIISDTTWHTMWHTMPQLPKVLKSEMVFLDERLSQNLLAFTPSSDTI